MHKPGREDIRNQPYPLAEAARYLKVAPQRCVRGRSDAAI